MHWILAKVLKFDEVPVNDIEFNQVFPDRGILATLYVGLYLLDLSVSEPLFVSLIILLVDVKVSVLVNQRALELGQDLNRSCVTQRVLRASY